MSLQTEPSNQEVNQVVTTVASYTIDAKEDPIKEEDLRDQEIRKQASNLADRIMSDLRDIQVEEGELKNSGQVIEEKIGKVKQIRKIFDKPSSGDHFQIGSTYQHRKIYYSPSPAKTDSLPRPPPVDQLEKQVQETYKTNCNIPKSTSVLQIRHLFETRDLANIMNRSNSNIDITSETKIECLSPNELKNNFNMSNQNIYQIDPSLSPIRNVQSTVKFHECSCYNMMRREQQPQTQYTAQLIKSGGLRSPSQTPYRSRSLTQSPRMTRVRSGSLTQRCQSPNPVVSYAELERNLESPLSRQNRHHHPDDAIDNSILTESLERPSRNRESLRTMCRQTPSVIPDGVYVRTGEVYEKMDDHTKRGPLGHWITTIVNKKGEEKCPTTPPITQVTNIWMNSEDRPSRDRLLLAENNNNNDNQRASLPARHNIGAIKCGRSSRSGHHSPVGHSVRWAFDGNSNTGNDAMPPYRTQHLRSWGSEVNCSTPNQKHSSLRNTERQQGRRNNNRSPTPLFHSPEQIERRIQELKESSYYTGDGSGCCAYQQNFCEDDGQPRYQKMPVRSNSISPCLHPQQHSIRLNDSQVQVYPERQNEQQYESGIDCSPISNDFQNKCAYFEDFSRIPREVFMSNKCTCSIHCPKIRLKPRDDDRMKRPKRSASVNEMRLNDHSIYSPQRYTIQQQVSQQPQTVRQFKRSTLQMNPGECHNYTIQTIWRPNYNDYN